MAIWKLSSRILRTRTLAPKPQPMYPSRIGKVVGGVIGRPAITRPTFSIQPTRANLPSRFVGRPFQAGRGFFRGGEGGAR